MSNLNQDDILPRSRPSRLSTSRFFRRSVSEAYVPSEERRTVTINNYFQSLQENNAFTTITRPLLDVSNQTRGKDQFHPDFKHGGNSSYNSIVTPCTFSKEFKHLRNNMDVKQENIFRNFSTKKDEYAVTTSIHSECPFNTQEEKGNNIYKDQLKEFLLKNYEEGKKCSRVSVSTGANVNPKSPLVNKALAPSTPLLCKSNMGASVYGLSTLTFTADKREKLKKIMESGNKQSTKENVFSSSKKLPSSLSKKRGVFNSSSKHQKNIGRNWMLNCRSKINAVPQVVITSPGPKEKECKRTLEFLDTCLDEEEEEETKPLPSIDLSLMETDGSMMCKTSTVLPQKQKSFNKFGYTCKPQLGAVNKNVNYKSSEMSKYDFDLDNLNMFGKSSSQHVSPMQDPNYSNFQPKNRRLSGIPVSKYSVQKLNKSPADFNQSQNLKKLRKSLIGKTNLTQSKEKLTVSPNRKNGYASLIYVPKPSTCINTGHVSSPKMFQTGVCQLTLKEPCISTSNSAIPASAINTDTCVAKFNSKNDPSTEKKIVMKDASTNTIGTENVGNSYFDEISKIKMMVAEQKHILEQAKTFFQSFTEEFRNTSSNLLQQCEASLEPVQSLLNIFEENMVLHQNASEKLTNVEENKNTVNGSTDEPVTGMKKLKPGSKFFGTPMPMKKKQWVRSLSSPTLSTREDESFNSSESVSPFTNMVGNCERGSLPPMTPRTRLNVTSIKVSLNEQLNMLFE